MRYASTVENPPDDDAMLRRLEDDLERAHAELRIAEQAAAPARLRIGHIDGLLRDLRHYLAGEPPEAAPAPSAGTRGMSEAQAIEDLVFSHRGPA